MQRTYGFIDIYFQMICGFQDILNHKIESFFSGLIPRFDLKEQNWGFGVRNIKKN